MSEYQFETGIVYEPPTKSREDPEREARLLILNLLINPGRFTLVEAARLKELLEELG